MKPLAIAGGTYREICRFPDHRVILGSGGRGAAAISSLNMSVTLHTYVPRCEQVDVQLQLEAFDFSTKCYDSPALVAFRYLHGLATPMAEPALNLLAQRRPMPFEVRGEVVLRYGMVEQEAIVYADVAVYDPQAPLQAQRFTANGSTAGRLAYVVNASEARLLSGSDDCREQIRWIVEHETAAAVVVKQGPHGAVVWEHDVITMVPCFKTNRVGPIGSGDVFSAVFAQLWGCEGATAHDAANSASLATAYYCETGSLPVPRSELSAVRLPLKPTVHEAPPRIYLAGPFFTLAQRWLIDDIRETLIGLNLAVFSPVHDVGEGPSHVVAPADLRGVEMSKVLLAVLDGLDAGTLVEVGYAIAKGIPVVAFTQTEKNDDLTMLHGTGCTIERDLVTAIYKASWLALEA